MLRYEVLSQISRGHPAAAKLARYCLRSINIDFDRWGKNEEA